MKTNSCPGCSVSFQLTDEMRGRKIQCPRCGQVLFYTTSGALQSEKAISTVRTAPPVAQGNQNTGVPPQKQASSALGVGVVLLLLALFLFGGLVLLGGGAALYFFVLAEKKQDSDTHVAKTGGSGEQTANGSGIQEQPRPPQSSAPPPRMLDKLHVLPKDAEIPAITYFFHDNLRAEEPGVPDLVPTDPLRSNGFEDAKVLGLQKRVYRFTGNAHPVERQSGLTFDNKKGWLPPDEYSVELVLMFLQGDGQWRRIVDVSDRQSDQGFYADPYNHLQVYPLPGEGRLITSGGYHHVVLTVGKGGTVKAYLNGSIQFTGFTQVMVFNNPRKVMHFFLDNVIGAGQGEFSNGKVAVIRLYNRVLSDAQVSRLADWVRGEESKVPDPVDESVLPDPGTLLGKENQIGKTFLYRVTGSTAGAIYGTDVYTADSSLAVAAVHAGVLKAGETQVVRVQVVAGLPSYKASVRYGISSFGWDSYPLAYTVSRKGSGR